MANIVSYQNYIIAFLDILRFRGIVKKYKSIDV